MKRKVLSLLVGAIGCAVVTQMAVAAGGYDERQPVSAKSDATFDYSAWYAKNASKIANRNALVGAVMQNLHADLQHLGASIEEKARLQMLLHSMPTNALERATALTKVSDVETLAIQSFADSSNPLRSAVQTKVLGDQGQDLIFNPYGPCRIVDTRGAAAGAITGGTARAFQNFNSTAQGTGTGNCNFLAGGPGTGLLSGTGGAIAITVTGVPPGATGSLYGNAGFLTARPVGDTNLTATALIQQGTPFTAANSTIIRTSTGVNDFEVYAAITSHVVVDLLGFYVPPAQTALDCVTETLDVAVANGARSFQTIACRAGYAVTGGGITTGFNDNQTVQASGPSPATNGWFASIVNNSGASRTYTFSARCCRTPGSTAGRF